MVVAVRENREISGGKKLIGKSGMDVSGNFKVGQGKIKC